MEHLSNDQEDHPNQHENSHKLCDEMQHPIMNQLGSQWKLRQHDQNLPMGGKKEINPKEHDYENHSLGSE